MQVNYDPQNPQKLTIGDKTSNMMYLPYVFIGGIDIFCLFIGFIGLIFSAVLLS